MTDRPSYQCCSRSPHAPGPGRPRARAAQHRSRAAARRRRRALRPHAKTHKSPVVARWQIERGAVGVCCAKVGEAEVFVAAGIGDIRLPYPVNPSNAARLLALMDRASISIIVDHLDVARGWSEAMAARRTHARRAGQGGRRISSLRHRSGAATRSTSFRRVSALPGLRLRGLLSHAGHGYHAASDDELARRRASRGGDSDVAARSRRRSRHPARGALGRRDADAPLQRRPSAV